MEIRANTYIPVSLQFANSFGDNPAFLPVPGGPSRFGVKPPEYAQDGTRYMLSNGEIWEYMGISPYSADNRERVNGWQLIGKL